MVAVVVYCEIVLSLQLFFHLSFEFLAFLQCLSLLLLLTCCLPIAQLFPVLKFLVLC